MIDNPPRVGAMAKEDSNEAEKEKFEQTEALKT